MLPSRTPLILRDCLESFPDFSRVVPLSDLSIDLVQSKQDLHQHGVLLDSGILGEGGLLYSDECHTAVLVGAHLSAVNLPGGNNFSCFFHSSSVQKHENYT